MKTLRPLLFGACLAVVFVLIMGACTQKDLERFRDAPVSGRNDGSAELITMPDGFSNVATKCDHGNRVYVTMHSSDGDGRGLAVVVGDPTC